MRIEKVILGFLLLITTAAYCQKNQIQVLSNEKVFGKSLVDSFVVKGMEYVFPDRIHETFLDTTTGLLTVQLRGLRKNGKWLDHSGKIIQFDIKNQRVLWSKKIAYQASNLKQFSKTIIHSFGNKSYCLDVNTGEELWKVKNDIYFVDPVDNIGIGYKFRNSTGYTNELEGIDLKNGNILWKRNLFREFGWNDVFYINDSTIIVVAAGLHAINIKTGIGWDYYSVTGHNLVRELVSNTLVDINNIYFASKEKLIKIDMQTGEVIWKFPFPDDIASKSTIFIKGNIIYMVNKGMAFMGNRKLDFGKPFFAAFDSQTGNQIFLSIIDVKDDPILSFELHSKDIYFTFKNRVAKYSMETGNEILQKSFPKDDFGELKCFVGCQVFITSQSGDLINLNQSDSTKLFVFTNQSKTLSLDEQLSISKTIDFNELSIYYEQKNDFKFITKDKNTLIVNKEGKRIAEVEATSKAFMIGNILYDTQGNNFTTIDMAKILTNE